MPDVIKINLTEDPLIKQRKERAEKQITKLEEERVLFESKLKKVRTELSIARREKKKIDSATARRARNHNLILLGLSVETILGLNFDKGVLVGFLEHHKNKLIDFNSSENQSYKSIGDRLIAEREAAAQRNKIGKVKVNE